MLSGEAERADPTWPGGLGEAWPSMGRPASDLLPLGTRTSVSVTSQRGRSGARSPLWAAGRAPATCRALLSGTGQLAVNVTRESLLWGIPRAGAETRMDSRKKLGVPGGHGDLEGTVAVRHMQGGCLQRGEQRGDSSPPSPRFSSAGHQHLRGSHTVRLEAVTPCTPLGGTRGFPVCPSQLPTCGEKDTRGVCPQWPAGYRGGSSPSDSGFVQLSSPPPNPGIAHRLPYPTRLMDPPGPQPGPPPRVSPARLLPC